jgi:uncharacterized protein YqeY
MTLKEQLMEDLKHAMRSGDELRRDTIRMARTAIKNTEMAQSSAILDMIALDDPKAKGGVYDEIRKHRKLAEEYEATEQMDLAKKEREEVASILARNTELNDAGVQDVIRKEIKQRREAADTYEKGKRMDLADKERAEAAILEAYLPKQMSPEEIETEVRGIIDEIGSREVSKVMPVAIRRLKGRADGRMVNQVVTRVLAEG